MKKMRSRLAWPMCYDGLHRCRHRGLAVRQHPRPTDGHPAGRRLAVLSSARMLARRGRHDEAAKVLASYPPGRPAHLGIESELRVTRAFVAVARREVAAIPLAEDAVRHASAQGAHRWRRCAELLRALAGPDSDLGHQVQQVARDSPHTLTYLVDLLVERLGDLDEPAMTLSGKRQNSMWSAGAPRCGASSTDAGTLRYLRRRYSN